MSYVIDRAEFVRDYLTTDYNLDGVIGLHGTTRGIVYIIEQ